MKKYSVSVFVPTTARMVVYAADKKDAISRARALLDMGEHPEFDLDPIDLEIANYYAEPVKEDRDCGSSGFTNNSYTVHLTATSIKDIPVDAPSPDAAEAMVRELYLQTDEFDFTDDDVTGIVAEVIPDACPAEAEQEDYRLKLATELVRLIRGCDEPDEVIAQLVDRHLLYYMDHPEVPIDEAESAG